MLEWTLIKSLRDLPNAAGRKLWFAEVHDLADLTPLFDRSDLEGLRIVMCKSFRSLAGIGRWPSLATLDVSHCPELESLDPIADLPNLRRFDMFGNNRLTSLRGLRALREPSELAIPLCKSLTDLSELAALPSLRKLTIEGCTAVTDIRVVGELKNLVTLSLKGCTSIETLDGFGEHPDLESLDLSGCMSLRDLRALGDLPSLRRLDVETATALESLDGIQHAPRLEWLRASACTRLRDIAALEATPAVRELSFMACPALEQADVLASLAALENLELWGTRVASLPPLPASLRTLSLNQTPMRSVACAFPCRSLEELRFENTQVTDRGEIAQVLALPHLKRIALPREALPLPSGAIQGGTVGVTQQIAALRQMFEPDLEKRARRWAGLEGPAHELELFRRVIDDPRDAEARLAYAAALQRAHEVRGEFIVLDMPSMNGPFAYPTQRASQLYQAHAMEWFYEVKRLVEYSTIGGGFVQGVTMSVERAARHGAELVARTPLRSIQFEGARAVDDRRDLFTGAWTSKLESIHWNYVQSDDLVALGRSQHLGRLTRLELSGPPVLDIDAATAIASLPALRELTLARANPVRGTFAPIATLPLTMLDLSGSYAVDEALLTIAASPAMSSLRVLRLAGCRYSNESLEALAASPHLGALEEVDLSGTSASGAAEYPTPLFRSSSLRSLRLVLAEAYWATDPSGDSIIETPHGPVTFRVRPGHNYY